MEGLLVATPSNSLEEIEAVVRLTVARFHEIMVTDPNDVFYDHGEARLVALDRARSRRSQRPDPALPLGRQLRRRRLRSARRSNAPER